MGGCMFCTFCCWFSVPFVRAKAAVETLTRLGTKEHRAEPPSPTVKSTAGEGKTVKALRRLQRSLIKLLSSRVTD